MVLDEPDMVLVGPDMVLVGHHMVLVGPQNYPMVLGWGSVGPDMVLDGPDMVLVGHHMVLVGPVIRDSKLSFLIYIGNNIDIKSRKCNIHDASGKDPRQQPSLCVGCWRKRSCVVKMMNYIRGN